MEPGHEDREYLGGGTITTDTDGPQWSPVMKTGNTWLSAIYYFVRHMPQWSPVMKTGNTALVLRRLPQPRRASMEPGHEDREY